MSVSTPITAAPPSMVLSQFVDRLKEKTIARIGPSCKHLIEDHFETIVSAAFKELGLSYELRSRINPKLKAETMEQIENEVAQSIVHVRNVKKTLSGREITAIPDCPSAPLKQGAWFSRQIKENLHDPKQIPVIQEKLKGIHLNSKVSFEDIPCSNDLQQDKLNPQVIHSLEYLSKSVAYHICPSTKEISLSVLVDGEMKFVTYSIEEIPLWMGITAYGLKPNDENAPPILLFCGTTPYPSGRGAGMTLVADLDPSGIGYQLFQRGSPSIEHWLQTNTKKKNAIVTGHSLGGALATYATVYHSKHVSQCVTFNGTAVSYLVEPTWKNLVNKPEIHNLIHPDDFIPKLGPIRLGQDYLVLTNHRKEVAKMGFFAKRPVIHITPLFDRSFILVKHQVKTGLPNMVWEGLLAPIYFIGISILYLKRWVFGYSFAPYWSYVLGPPLFIVEQFAELILRISSATLHLFVGNRPRTAPA